MRELQICTLVDLETICDVRPAKFPVVEPLTEEQWEHIDTFELTKDLLDGKTKREESKDDLESYLETLFPDPSEK